MTLRFTTLRFTTVLLLPCAALNLDDLQRAPIVRRRAALQAAGAALLARPRAAAAKLGEYQYDENRLARDSSAFDTDAARDFLTGFKRLLSYFEKHGVMQKKLVAGKA